jgi:hypothetical protein
VSVTLAVYTCKRPEKAAETLASLELHCRDRHRIERIVLSDDSSDPRDLIPTLETLARLFPGKPLTLKHRQNERGFIENWAAGWREAVTPYVLHLEDDWVFTAPGDYLGYGISVLEHDPDLAQVVFAYQAPGSHYLPYAVAEERVALGEDFYLTWPRDNIWPGYTSNPSLVHLARLRERLDNPYPEVWRSGEWHFGVRVKEAGLRTAFLPRPVMRHLGGVSAFALNQTLA